MNLLGAIGVGLRAGMGPRSSRARSARGERGAGPLRARGPASRSWWSWTTRTRRTRSSACWPPRASSPAAAGSAWCSAAAAIAIAASGRSWARSPRGSADRAWVTSDNPRRERPEAIVDEIVAGMRRGRRRGRSRARARPARRAIGARSAWARAGDTVRDRGQGARDLPDHRRRGAAVRRPRGGARRPAGRAPA